MPNFGNLRIFKHAINESCIEWWWYYKDKKNNFLFLLVEAFPSRPAVRRAVGPQDQADLQGNHAREASGTGRDGQWFQSRDTITLIYYLLRCLNWKLNTAQPLLHYPRMHLCVIALTVISSLFRILFSRACIQSRDTYPPIYFTCFCVSQYQQLYAV